RNVTGVQTCALPILQSIEKWSENMKFINQFPIENFPIKNILLILFFFLFLAGIALIVSGMKILAENKLAKILTLILGIVLLIISFFSAIFVVMFGYNS